MYEKIYTQDELKRINDARTAIPGHRYVDTWGNNYIGTSYRKINSLAGTSAVWGNITGDISDQSDLIALFATKQDLLVSGVNIKTVNGISLLGPGDITIVGAVQSVTGLDTDNTDPLNPIVKIAVDGVTITGDGTSGNPLVADIGSCNQKLIAYNNLSVTHTGNVTQTVVRSFQIPTTEIDANSVIEILAQFGSSGGAFTKTLRVYFNTSNTLVGATLIGTQQLSAAQFYGGFRRQIVNKNSINTNRIIPSAAVQVTDITNLTVNMANLNWNFSGTTWLIATIQLGGAAASATLENIQVKLSKP